MPRIEAVMSIFLASPGDVTDERIKLTEIISDWNQVWSRNLGLRLELIKWETDAYPGVGKDAQDVINQQIPNDYDLFVGIMWSRFGTPTSRAGSGTQEEFQSALSRYRSDPEGVSIFFYFKDAPIAPSKIDTEQLRNVQEFKDSLGREGILHWGFSDLDQFEKLFAMHVTRHVQAWKHKNPERIHEKSPPMQKDVDSENKQQSQPLDDYSDDDGYLDLLETFFERNDDLVEIVNRISQAQNDLADKTTQGTKDLSALHEAPGSPHPNQARRLISKVADEMVRFTDRINAEIPLFRSAIGTSMRALSRAATLSKEFDPENFLNAKFAATKLLVSLQEATQATLGFKASTAGLPRITKELNTAKRLQASTLDALIAEFENAQRLLTEAIAVIETLSPVDGS